MERREGGSAEPILALLRRSEEWITNKELGAALGINGRSNSILVTSGWSDLNEELGPGQTTILRDIVDRFGKRRAVRAFTKRAAILIAIRHRSPNGVAFRHWLVAKAAEMEIWNA